MLPKRPPFQLEQCVARLRPEESEEAKRSAVLELLRGIEDSQAHAPGGGSARGGARVAERLVHDPAALPRLAALLRDRRAPGSSRASSAFALQAVSEGGAAAA